MTSRVWLRPLPGALLVTVLAAGCATRVQGVDENHGEPLPRTDMVLVHDFAYSPDQVRLDRGISPRIEAALAGEPRSQKEIGIGGQVSNAMVAHRVEDIRQTGLPAQRADLGYVPRGNTYAVETLGVGDATGLLVASAVVSAAGSVASEAFGTNVDADAARAPSAIAEELEPSARKQDWIQAK